MQPAALGRYRIVGVLGRGGMGVVYEGHDPQIERAVAIKTIALDALNEQEKAMFEARFRAEMRSAGRLQHHNIAALYDTGRDGGSAFIVMERVTGHDLKRRLVAGERFSVSQSVDITVQLLAALEFAHRRQVIHRDVKPANVMLQSDGVVKLCDFGVAQLTDSDATRTQGMVVGSLRYASPEQILGQPIDARTDVFSTGVLLFELLTGELPFRGQSDVEILHRIATDQAPSPRSIDPSIPIEIDDAVQRAMARDPADRFASAKEFARALGASSIPSLDTLPVMPLASSPAASPASVGAPAPGKFPWAVAAGCGAILVALGAWYTLQPAPIVKFGRSLAVSAPDRTLASASAPAPAPVPSSAPGLVPAPTATAAAPATPKPAAPASVPAHIRPGAAAPTKLSAIPAAVPSKPAPAVRPAEGAWRGQLACGPILSETTGPGSGAFTAELSIEINGPRIVWMRNTSIVNETVVGTFDVQGRFSAEGQGSRKDRPEYWRVRARGEFVPKTDRIEGRVQLLRSNDSSVARECTLVAGRGAAPAVAATTDRPASSTSSQRILAIPPGAWSGRLACGATLSANVAHPEANAFTADMAVDIVGTRITLARNQASYTEKSVGFVDGQGRFSANGYGSYTDHHADWRVQARGEFQPKANRIEGRVQLLRTSDGGVARECTLRADRP